MLEENRNKPRLEDAEPGEELKEKTNVPVSAIIIFGVLIVLIAVCIIVIACNGGFNK